MRIALICFTERGWETEKRAAALLWSAGHEAMPYVLGRYALAAASKDHSMSFEAVPEGKLAQWAKKAWAEDGALVFVGACGIAVRAIAPWVRDKFTDPAVLAVDEAAQFVIPLLSGHMGGANALAKLLADGLSAIPAITTATDVNHKFAVDVFARERGLAIADRGLAKLVSADILAGEPVGFFSDFAVPGRLPEGLFKDRICQRNIWITLSKKEMAGVADGRLLRLVPRCAAVGIGCRRGTGAEILREALAAAFAKNQVDPACVCMLASIDLKQNEAGILELARELDVPFLTYSAQELAAVPGTFAESEFVRETTGVGNVCERAAFAALGEGTDRCRLLIPKTARAGVTIAAAYFAL